MVIDRETIQKKLAELEKYVTELTKHQYYTVEDLRKDLGKQWMVSHGLQLAIQVILDVGNHILSDRGINAEDYTDVIDKMGEHSILPPKFAKRIRGMAGFRNVIIHGYSVLDLNKLHSVLKDSLADFLEFARYITGFLEDDQKNKDKAMRQTEHNCKRL
ncbi:MAG: DUF86 domain-containing protein [Bacillota bacterium]